MAKNQIELNPELMEKIRPLAVKNGVVPTNQNLVDLAVKVTVEMIENLDSQDFENVCNLKK